MDKIWKVILLLFVVLFSNSCIGDQNESKNCECPLIDRYQEYIIFLKDSSGFKEEDIDANFQINTLLKSIPIDIKIEGGKQKTFYDDQEEFVTYSVDSDEIIGYNRAITSYCAGYRNICENVENTAEKRKELEKLRQELRKDLDLDQKEVTNDEINDEIIEKEEEEIQDIVISEKKEGHTETSVTEIRSVNDTIRKSATNETTITVIRDTIRILADKVKETPDPLSALSKDKLAVLVFNFLRDFKKWSFNSSRIREWGGRKKNFKNLRLYKSSEIESVLLLMAKNGMVNSHISEKGSHMFGYNKTLRNSVKFEKLID